jgi:putative transcriptional regulator
MTHPSDDHLIEYAAGALPRGMALLAASHLTFCPRCRDRVARFETIGGALLRAADPSGVAPPDFAAVAARLSEPEAPKAAGGALAADPILPNPILRELGAGAAAIRWRRLLPGLADFRLEGDPGEDVRLFRARPGARIATHTHEAEEATLVLAGSIADDGRTYRRGDVSLSGPEDDHSPRSAGPGDCVCLIVLSGRMRFTGRLGRVLNLFS